MCATSIIVIINFKKMMLRENSKKKKKLVLRENLEITFHFLYKLPNEALVTIFIAKWQLAD
jgi:hypothetical protein